MEQHEVEDEPHDAIGADAAVFHDVENALAVGSACAEAVDEVGKSVFMQGSGDENAHDDGGHGGQRCRHNERTKVKGGCHATGGEPASERP